MGWSDGATITLPLGRLAWLVHRYSEDARPQSEREAHYHYRWVNKRAGGRRLIESPKRTLKQAQRRILREILDKVPPHDAAHGFSAGRSILTNARPHVRQAVLVKFDLSNFYPSVTFARVTAIFRSLGYSREAAIWLARLTTSAKPALPSIVELGDGEVVKGRVCCDDLETIWLDEITRDLGALSAGAMARIDDGLRAALALN